MKHQFESQETFKAYQTIQSGYEKLLKLGSNYSEHPCITERLKKSLAVRIPVNNVRTAANNSVEYLYDIIAAKELIEMDSSNDELEIKALTDFVTSLPK